MKYLTSLRALKVTALLYGGSLGLLACVPSVQATTQVFVTGFIKDHNVYTNLNQQFPNTGAGTPGSDAGVANATFLFDPSTYTSPNAVAGSNLANNETTFQLASDAAGHDFATSNASFVVPVNLAGVVSFHTLTAAYFGSNESVTFLGSAGATETFQFSVPNFFGGGTINQSSAVNGSSTNNLLDQTAFQVNDVGAGGTGNSATGGNGSYFLTEQSFVLDPAFAKQTLTSVSINQRSETVLVLGLTADLVPEPSTWATVFGGIGFLTLVLRRRAVR